MIFSVHVDSEKPPSQFPENPEITFFDMVDAFLSWDDTESVCVGSSIIFLFFLSSYKYEKEKKSYCIKLLTVDQQQSNKMDLLESVEVGSWQQENNFFDFGLSEWKLVFSLWLRFPVCKKAF